MSDLTTWYLEMRDRGQLRPKAGPTGFGVSMLAEPSPDINLRFYREVGGDWGWASRLKWTDAQWLAYLDRPALTTGVVHVAGQAAGYFELEAQEEGEVEIMQLGLLPEQVGRGLGGALVTAALESAWAIAETRRVWLHTCSRDHKNALGNYQRRGLVLYKTLVE